MRKFTRTLEVRVPVERAWAAFTRTEERSQWEADPYEIDPRPGGAVRWVLPGIEAHGEVITVEPLKSIHHVERDGPHAGQETTVAFEECESGTRITVTHAGFGDGAEFDDALESTRLGWTQALTDLVAYLETGVAPRRFLTPWFDSGAQLRETPAGLLVVDVAAGGLADSAGLASGDLLITFAGVPVYTRGELVALLRASASADKIELEWIRDGERMAGSGPLAAPGS